MCRTLARDLAKDTSILHASKSQTDGERTVFYARTWVTGVGSFGACFSRGANSYEKDSFDKNNPKKDK